MSNTDSDGTIVLSRSVRDYFKFLEAKNPPILRIWVAANESDYMDAVEDAIEQGIRQIEEGARRYGSLDEIGLSLLLSQLLTAGGVQALAEGYHNGHVDIILSDPTGRFGKMLGECKIYRGPRYHCDGCGQLLNRYHSGRTRRGMCLDFFLTDGMYAKLGELRKHVDHELPHRQQRASADHKIKGGFVTPHMHFTETEVEVLHCGCNVFHPDK